MTDVPMTVSVTFIVTTMITLIFFLRAIHQPKFTVLVLLFWLIIQAVISMTMFYTVTNSIPPRFLLMVAPPMLLITLLFVLNQGRAFIDAADLKDLTILHIIRIPVELVLYWLFLAKKVPDLMTFEGRNFDILSGLTAPLVYLFGFRNGTVNRNLLLVWNLVCLLLLVNIVVNAVLSAPFPFQQFGFDQPNVAVLYFPFSWLPSFIVPIVLLSHLIAIRKLLTMHSPMLQRK